MGSENRSKGPTEGRGVMKEGEKLRGGGTKRSRMRREKDGRGGGA